ncbi:MAG: hypothetical protein M3186_08690 [Actinomycetota bacterium]|nr:hypothetical protein [Actinomycetota bacterium]
MPKGAWQRLSAGPGTRRWTIEESFQAAKGLAGVDNHQAGRWLAWRCWTLLAMLAHAYSRSSPRPNAEHPAPGELITLTRDPTPVTS